MRKLLTILFILTTGVCFGQINIGQRQIFKLRDTLDAIHVRINSTVNISDTSSMLTKYLRKSDTTAMLSQYKHWLAGYLTSASITGKLNISDTSTMLAPYLRRSDTTTMLSKYLRSSDATNTYATIANLALKINISDSSAMLSKYLRRSDTTVMLTPYLRSSTATATYATIANLALKNNISDTASMLSKYLRRSDTTVMLSPYHRTSDFNTATALKLNISDTSSMLSKYLRRSDTTVMLSPYLRSATAAATYATNQAIHDSINAVNNIDTLRNALTANSNPILNPITATHTLVRRLKFSGSGVDTTASNDSTISIVVTGGSTDTTSLSNRINLKVNISDTATMLSKYLRRSDTTTMLTPYQRLSDAAATYATISNLALKNNISDTASMLSKYLRRSDTTTMLSPYYRTSDATVALALKANLASPTFTGTPAGPTAAVATNTTQLATTAFVLANQMFQSPDLTMAATSPADAALLYFGGIGTYFGCASVAANRQVAVPVNCTLIGYEIVTWQTSTPTQETSTMSIRINNTTDVTLSSAVIFNAGNQTINEFHSMAMSTSLTAGDKYEIKWQCPTWTTNPTGVQVTIKLFFIPR